MFYFIFTYTFNAQHVCICIYLNIFYLYFVSVRSCVRACVRVCVRACVRACVHGLLLEINIYYELSAFSRLFGQMVFGLGCLKGEKPHIARIPNKHVIIIRSVSDIFGWYRDRTDRPPDPFSASLRY